MIRKLAKITAVLIILFLLPIASTQASGKMEVKIGEKVTLQGDDVEPGSVYKWTVKQGKEIISTQTSPIFNYTFVQQGEYDVSLILTNSLGDIRTATISILAGDKYPRPSVPGAEVPSGKPALFVSYSTLPHIQQDGAVHLIGGGKVLFNIDVIRDDVLEYRIDRNIFSDSDGNGVANDDIDNANDDSYLLGGIWETEYELGEATKIVAEITLVTKEGEKTKAQTEIVFDDVVQEGDPVAMLEVTPAPDPGDQLIHLYDDPSVVAFYARRSEGKILEYRIDKNIFVDSDGDGNPANDIDNINDASFKTGDVWQTEYNKTDQQIIAQLIVVGEGGKGSRVQRGIWFTDKPKPPTIIEVQDQIRLTADKEFVVKGDPIYFTVEGLTQTLDSYIFAWDFDGDGVMDKEIEANNTADHIYDFAGVYTASVNIMDKQENTADFTLDVVVKDSVTTTADFGFEVEGNTVKFTSISVADFKLANKTLDYTWSFGDTDPLSYEEQKDQIGAENPIYTYNKAGNYIVTLTVADANDVIDTKTAEVFIESDLVVEPEEPEIIEDTTAETPKEGSSFIIKMLKVILYLILIVIVLIVLIVIGFLAFLKLQHPDLTFEELVDEVKIKILSMLGVHEMIEKPSLGAEESILEPMEEVSEEPIEGEVAEPEESITEEVEQVREKEPPLAKKTGPVPDWMKMAEKPAPVSRIKEESKEVQEQAAEIEEKASESEPAGPEEPIAGTEIEEGEEVEISEEDKSDKNQPPKNGGGAPPLSDQSGPVPDWLKGA